MGRTHDAHGLLGRRALSSDATLAGGSDLRGRRSGCGSWEDFDPMRRFNVLTDQLPVEQNRSGYAWSGRRGMARELGLRCFGASVYELADGQWTFPYHYHHGVEEWLYVVAGAPTLRDPTGKRVLAPGDLVCFPGGPDGAHAVSGPGRVVMFSGVAAAGVATVSIYPDSDKVGVRPPGGGSDRLDFRRGDAVDYWDGE
jgi:uncharacterized cupin superfamily protein